MEEFIIDQVKDDNEYQNEVKNNIVEYNNLSIISQAEAGKHLLYKNRQLERGMIIMGDIIYDKTLENKILKESQQRLGVYSEKDVQAVINKKKKLNTNKEKNSLIMDEIKMHLDKNRQLTG